jgi:hypothetical protein
MFNDPAVSNIDEQYKGWTPEQYKDRAGVVIAMKDLPILCVPPTYWRETVDNTRDEKFLLQGRELINAKKLKEAFEWYMKPLVELKVTARSRSFALARAAVASLSHALFADDDG